ncbi:hypothetical protein BDZ90DRAFT_261278 [Jaminaea rosea]|uniref:Uncharacterized protein n=1 Tax=Jaminaea rosea TaxID=1569628 RepID=A0A316UTP9_9BASI|nr:hypothetical protein BDZ90DRAFT_261278 [Jaminaea rosea]PWN26465.1 hypothetical protein BDZ90DRAFT_261278 [Jaminaea rosea]
MLAFALHLAFALVLTVFPPWRLADAKHATCFWRPGAGSPANFGYKVFCAAGLENPLNSTDVAEYTCQLAIIGKTYERVADWGFLKPKTLEIGTPCGDKGYGVDDNILIPAAFVFACVGRMALTKHVVCTYKPGSKNPSTYQYKLYCVANKSGSAESTEVAIYNCSSQLGDNRNARVADYGFLAPKTLEMATPCGSGGYGFAADGGCHSRHWAMCLDNSDLGNCYYMDRHDDCEWPGKLEYAKLPTTITIWYFAPP